ncbi:hypothetical protein [Bacillus fungorum]|uniref:Uncharacterized protein n=1 Tax=Bacillus fungorum TaxID=2039284 RepID=A0A2G6Q5M9_9BACI|nr:hypothetical protein [Bacillus fungorum]PIE92133.1 hypothetical protein CO726_28140 [Bacillus fungorum]
MNTLVVKSSQNKKEVLGILALGSIMGAILLIANMGISFNISNLVPSISYAAALTGCYRARRAWKAGKDIKKALTVFMSWNVLGIVVSVLGDAAITYLLDNHVEMLAKH